MVPFEALMYLLVHEDSSKVAHNVDAEVHQYLINFSSVVVLTRRR